MAQHVNDADYKVNRTIMTPKNVDVDKINEILISMFPSEEKEYTSWDTVVEDTNNLFQEEFLNSLNPSCLPSHKIVLKVAFPIMLFEKCGARTWTM